MKPTLSMNSNHIMVRELKDYLMIALGMIFTESDGLFFVAKRFAFRGGSGYCLYCLLGNRFAGTIHLFCHQCFPLVAFAEDFRLEIQHEDGVCRFCPDIFPFRDTAFDFRASTIERPAVYGLYLGGYLLR